MGSMTTHPRPDGSDKQLGTLLDTVAVLREVEGALTLQLTRHLTAHPALTRGSESLSVEDRIQNTVSNRAVIQAMTGKNRPIHLPEALIVAGAAVALGESAPDLAAEILERKEIPVGQIKIIAGHTPKAQKAADKLSAAIQQKYGTAATQNPAVVPMPPTRQTPKTPEKAAESEYEPEE